jgi:hypothetical protein
MIALSIRLLLQTLGRCGPMATLGVRKRADWPNNCEKIEK